MDELSYVSGGFDGSGGDFDSFGKKKKEKPKTPPPTEETVIVTAGRLLTGGLGLIGAIGGAIGGFVAFAADALSIFNKPEPVPVETDLPASWADANPDLIPFDGNNNGKNDFWFRKDGSGFYSDPDEDGQKLIYENSPMAIKG
jgi:hypothetical protein